MHGFVPHCGRCGHAMPCACQASAMQVPPPPPPAQPTRRRIGERYGLRFCANCGFPEAACGCDRETTTPAAPDGAESDLNARIRTLKGGP